MKNESTDDNAVVGEILKGNEDAWKVLFDRYWARLVGLARNRTDLEAEDIAQLALTKAMKTLSSYDQNKGSFDRWLFTICGNVVIDENRRRNSRIRLVEFPVEPNLYDDERNDAVDELELKSFLEMVGLLPDRERQLVNALALLGVDAETSAIAAYMGVSPGNVRILKLRAFRHLREIRANRERTP